MRLPRLKKTALALPATTVVSQWGGLVFKVAGKVFLVVSLDGDVPEGLSIKCTPAEFAGLTEIDGIIQAPYFAKRHWVHVEDFGALTETELFNRIRRSYDLVVAGLPRKTRAELAG